MRLGGARAVFFDLVVIFAVWTVLIGTMLLLQGSDYNSAFGFGRSANLETGSRSKRMVPVLVRRNCFGRWTIATACLLGGI